MRLFVLILGIALGCGGTLFYFQLQKDQPTLNPSDAALEAEAVQQVLDINLAAMGDEKLDRAMATIHPNSPLFAQNRKTIEVIFKQYDLAYKFLSAEFLGQSGNIATVRAKQETSKRSGPAFRDNIIDVIHVLRKYESQWKIWNTVILDVSYKS